MIVRHQKKPNFCCKPWEITSYSLSDAGFIIKKLQRIELHSADFLLLKTPHSGKGFRLKTVSGCRESNSAYLLPKQTYYRYTTPRHKTQSLSPHETVGKS